MTATRPQRCRFCHRPAKHHTPQGHYCRRCHTAYTTGAYEALYDNNPPWQERGIG